jgi:hypothetical protein
MQRACLDSPTAILEHENGTYLTGRGNCLFFPAKATALGPFLTKAPVVKAVAENANAAKDTKTLLAIMMMFF